MVSEKCDLSLIHALPDDIFAIVSRSLSPRDVCNLSLCCRSLCALVESEKVWLSQCEVLGIVPAKDLIEWRKGVSSYKALCHFLVAVQPLLGIWVHQNPELGNVVYAMPGFVSVVGCRVIPQELGPLGIEDGPILWAPVFEVIGDFDGSAMFLLHGREKGNDYFYPGSVKVSDRSCNVLLLEVEPRLQRNGGKLVYSKSFAHYPEKEYPIEVCRSDSGLNRSDGVVGQNEMRVPFGRLGFSDRRKLLEVVTSQVRQKVHDSAHGPLFPRLRDDEESFQKDLKLLAERRSSLLQSCKLGGGHKDWNSEKPLDPTQLELSEIRKTLDRSTSTSKSSTGDDSTEMCMKKKTVGGYVRNSIKQILRKSNSFNGRHTALKNGASSSENKHAQLHEFLRSGDTIGLNLHASYIKLSSYRAWPNMHDSRFALYKLPLRAPKPDQEYAGLWGGTFGWPPGKPTEDKPGKALFFLMLSYEESQGQRFLIATKILEGTHYVLHPNGSAMFIVNIDQPSEDIFPWNTDANGHSVTVENAFPGEGIANGYGFRYPGAKPGSLYIIQNGLLAFIWKESKAVLTLQRLSLQDLLKKGERVPALSATSNFSYLTKSYSNVFAGFSHSSTSLNSPRQKGL
ncbi:F-box protein At5g39450-like [Punica granatum]|uniref:F-box protein At5g39450-like n=1 Tax=Punica granatum TaxID=22663 RepID=A0A6P8CQA2_PUNGR|nr:F-box protein At5g39450-like [Punica granatum]